MPVTNDKLYRTDMSTTDSNNPPGNGPTGAASSSATPSPATKVNAIPKSKLPYVPPPPARPISGFSLFFSAAWAMVRGWFERKK
jgi:hypothetical protein